MERPGQISYESNGETRVVGYIASQTSDGFVGRITSKTPFHLGAIDRIVSIAGREFQTPHASVYYILRGSKESVLIDKSHVYTIDADGNVLADKGNWINGIDLFQVGALAQVDCKPVPLGSRPEYMDLGRLESVEFVATREKPPMEVPIWGIRRT